MVSGHPTHRLLKRLGFQQSARKALAAPPTAAAAGNKSGARVGWRLDPAGSGGPGAGYRLLQITVCAVVKRGPRLGGSKPSKTAARQKPVSRGP